VQAREDSTRRSARVYRKCHVAYHNFLPARIWIFWALFLVRGTFYSAMLPMWEGWDEYAHFAWIQHWNDQGTLPRTTDSISREIDESMRLAPLPWELN
jgi:hypothetical protein